MITFIITFLLSHLLLINNFIIKFPISYSKEN